MKQKSVEHGMLEQASPHSGTPAHSYTRRARRLLSFCSPTPLVWPLDAPCRRHGTSASMLHCDSAVFGTRGSQALILQDLHLWPHSAPDLSPTQPPAAAL